MAMLIWLADVLRAAGLTVIEEEGWKEAGRGEMGTVKGILLHHTAGSKRGNSPSLNLVKNGRSDLPGPLSQLFLARDGTFHVVGAGRCNHAGAGSWHGVTSGNTNFIGIEAENAGDGTDLWPDVQMDAYERGVAAILMHLGLDSVMAAGHKEYCIPRGRKIDPSFDMVQFRQNVDRLMVAGGARKNISPVSPANAMLHKGDRGESVKLLQTKLGITADGQFGPQTEKAVRIFQQQEGLMIDGLVGPATWKALGV